MSDDILFSEETPSFDWLDAASKKTVYGPKGAFLAALPRFWTPPFVLLPASLFAGRRTAGGEKLVKLPKPVLAKIRSLAISGQIIVRSSVIGETIWDRGTYKSEIVDAAGEGFDERLLLAAENVLASAQGKQSGIVVQKYVKPKSRGEFGNLQRLSKTRDHWELSSIASNDVTTRDRFNTQRDEAASDRAILAVRSGQSRERQFGSIAAWLNNVLLQGKSQRLSCEWVVDDRQIYLVQLDEEDEDFGGCNPFQIRVAPIHQPVAAKGTLLTPAEGAALQAWDKLRVLEELGEPTATHRPMLFYVELADLIRVQKSQLKGNLEKDFRDLIGPDSIVVRTSGRVGDKVPNLPRTECLTPAEAADWCINELASLKAAGTAKNLAFVAHRFISARASAWVRAEPDSANVEIHSLWGLPDGLQTCPYDIWEVHIHSKVATDYPEYKSNMLIARENGDWEYVRIKNELARGLSVGRPEALDLALRTHAIAQRLGKPCHVMWFVGCANNDGTKFNIPWYWTEAHDAEKNPDRANYQIFTIADQEALERFKVQLDARWRQAIELKPSNPNLMRDSAFIDAVGKAAHDAGVPVILEGSTLAHAYYQLRRQGCTVVTRGEKEHSRVRRTATFGKLVRDEIPSRIAKRQEAEVTRTIPAEVLKGFLVGKLLEEALEVRSAVGVEQKAAELADLYEVFRALLQAEGIPLQEIETKAKEKRNKAGGFDKGFVLLQTGILGRNRTAMASASQPLTQVLARKNPSGSYDIPFSFFGFMEFDQPRVLDFEEAGVRVSVQLHSDRVELSLSKEERQLELPLDLAVEADASQATRGEATTSAGRPKPKRPRARSRKGTLRASSSGSRRLSKKVKRTKRR